MITTRVATAADLPHILTLQHLAHRNTVTEDEALTDGFVSWMHDLETLTALNAPIPHTIAIDEHGAVIAYALSMSPAHRHLMDAAEPLFTAIEELDYRGRRIGEMRYTVMGQVCVAQAWRGKGVFRQLYAAWFAAQAAAFELGMTEIAVGNRRSREAHAAVGWEEVGRTNAGAEEWILVAHGLGAGT